MKSTEWLLACLWQTWCFRLLQVCLPSLLLDKFSVVQLLRHSPAWDKSLLKNRCLWAAAISVGCKVLFTRQ